MDSSELDGSVENLDMMNTLEQLRNRQSELSRKELYSEEDLEPVVGSGFVALSESKEHYGDEVRRHAADKNRKKSLSDGAGYSVVLDDSPYPRKTGGDSQKFESYNSQKDLVFAEADTDHQHLPEWFMDCSRTEAEELLSRSRNSGNVLMRKSSSYSTNGNYVITLRRNQNGFPMISHYSVMKCREGFKLDVQNQHRAMHSLSEVMDFFVSVAGPGTRPFSSTGANSH